MLRQFGAIPFVLHEEEPLVLMITSRTQERWIFPKGGLEGSETPVEAASREAIEEAGVKGVSSPELSLEVQAVKIADGNSQDMLVTYFPLRVVEQMDDWSERKRRDRHWVTLADARKIVGGPDILEALESFIGLIPKLQIIDSNK